MKSYKIKNKKVFLISTFLSAISITSVYAQPNQLATASAEGKAPTALPVEGATLAPSIDGKGTVGASKDGFSIKSADGTYQLKFKGLVQLDGRFYPDTPADLGQGNHSFVARRVRPTLEGSLGKYVDFKLMPDFGLGTTVLQDAYADVKFAKPFAIRFGKFREPVGLERLQSASAIGFVERGLPTNLVPNRDLGVQAFGTVGVLDYALGVFNGVADGASGDSDGTDDKDIAGRVFVKPFLKSNIDALQNLGVGFAATYGKNLGVASATGVAGTPNIKSGGQQTIFKYNSFDATKTDNSGAVFADGTEVRLTPQLRYDVGSFGLWSEYVRSAQDVSNGAGKSDTFVNQAWQVAASYVLTGEKSSAKGVSPKKPLDPSKGQWGAVEVAARYNELDIDNDVFPTFANTEKSVSKASGFAGGVNWYLNDNVKWVLDYEHTTFDGGHKSGTDRRAEHALFARTQLSF